MGSPTVDADMQAAAAAVLFLVAGLVSADGGDHGDRAAHDHGTVLAEPLAAQPDTSNYYSQQAYTDTFAPTAEGFYDPYASNFLTQEQDRTDTGVLGGLTIGVLATVFLAALLGSIVAPALTAAVTSTTDSGDGVIVARRGTELVSKVQLPEITLKDVESEDDMDTEDTARALKAGLSFVQNLVSPRVKRS